mgnify:FL=1
MKENGPRRTKDNLFAGRLSRWLEKLHDNGLAKYPPMYAWRCIDAICLSDSQHLYPDRGRCMEFWLHKNLPNKPAQGFFDDTVSTRRIVGNIRKIRKNTKVHGQLIRRDSKWLRAVYSMQGNDKHCLRAVVSAPSGVILQNIGDHCICISFEKTSISKNQYLSASSAESEWNGQSQLRQ